MKARISEIPLSSIPSDELHPLEFAQKWVKAEGDFEVLARERHGNYDLVKVRDLALLRLISMNPEESWWVKGKILYPTMDHLWMLCLGHTETPGNLEDWCKGGYLGGLDLVCGF